MFQQNKHDNIENLIKFVQYFKVTMEFSSSDVKILIFSNTNFVNFLWVFLFEHAFHQCSQRLLVLQILFQTQMHFFSFHFDFKASRIFL